ncbi:MAG: LamG-like jellyroll fold domain-containing protein [Candidatus Methanomethylicaceae archaeon]
MSNNFSSSPEIYAHWRFEPAGLTTDSRNLNHLLAYNSPSSNTIDFVEGLGSAQLNCYRQSTGTQAFYIPDASLSSGFPLKSGDTTRAWFWSLWLKLESPVGYNERQYVIGKWGSVNAERCFALVIDNGSTLRYVYATNSTGGTSTRDIGSLSPGTWYWIGVSGSNRTVRVYIYDVVIQTTIFVTYTESYDLYVGNGAFCIGSSQQFAQGFKGILDEVVVGSTNSVYYFDLIRVGIYNNHINNGVYAPISNTFTDDASAVAYWRFEPESLTTDSISNLSLTPSASAPTSDTYYVKEGTGSVKFEDTSTQYYYINDADLPSTFPLKSTDTKKTGTWCFWIRPETIPGSGNYDYIISKYNAGSNKRSLAFLLYYNRFQIYWGYSGTGSSNVSVDIAYNNLDSTWYFVGIAFDGVNKFLYWYVYSYLRQKMWDGWLNPGYEMAINDSAFTIGNRSDGTYCYDGWLDGLIIFNRVLTPCEIQSVMQGKFSSTYKAVYNYKLGLHIAYKSKDSGPSFCINPRGVGTSSSEFDLLGYGGSNYNYGTSWDQALQTWKGIAIPTGSKILCRKSSEATVPDLTAAVTTGSRVITVAGSTANLDLYDIIKFEGDDSLYCVRVIGANSITLYRPYRGATRSCTINKLFPYDLGNNHYTMWNAQGRPGLTTFLLCGVDPSSNTQDGFTLFQSLTTLSDSITLTAPFTYVSRYAISSGGTSFRLQGCHRSTFEKIYIFRSIEGFYAYGFTTGVRAREIILEGPIFSLSAIARSEFYDCESFPNNTSSSSLLLTGATNCYFYGFRQGHGGAGIEAGTVFGIALHNCVFGEAQTNYYGDIVCNTNAARWEDFTLRDCTLQSPTLISTIYYYCGEVRFENFNCTTGDHRRYVGKGYSYSGETPWSAIVRADYSVYRTQAPAVKVEFSTCYYTHAVVEKFALPCDANEGKLISVYVRKNSQYGMTPNATPPKLTARYPVLVSGVTTWVTVSDFDSTSEFDTWIPLTVAITPCMTCAIDVELSFWSQNSGAVAWYDDFVISEL